MAKYLSSKEAQARIRKTNGHRFRFVFLSQWATRSIVLLLLCCRDSSSIFHTIRIDGNASTSQTTFCTGTRSGETHYMYWECPHKSKPNLSCLTTNCANCYKCCHPFNEHRASLHCYLAPSYAWLQTQNVLRGHLQNRDKCTLERSKLFFTGKKIVGRRQLYARHFKSVSTQVVIPH